MRKLLAGGDTVFHLAALIGIPYSYVAPQHYLNVNIQGTLNVLEACLQNNIARLVHTSTSEAYGTARYTPIDESHPLQGQSPYSASKIAADKLVESYHLSFELPAVTVRPFNTYGPRQSARAFIPSMISQALVQPVIRTGDLTPARDLCFVTDTVAGFLAAGSQDQAIGQLINVGTGVSYAMSDVLERILNLTGLPRPEIQTDSDRIRPANSEVLLLECNAQKARDMLGWTPTVNLNQGLQLTIEDIRRHPGTISGLKLCHLRTVFFCCPEKTSGRLTRCFRRPAE